MQIFHFKGRYANYLIFIFMNINENVENKWQSLKNIIMLISAQNY